LISDLEHSDTNHLERGRHEWSREEIRRPASMLVTTNSNVGLAVASTSKINTYVPAR
jgi:hypothetical protein